MRDKRIAIRVDKARLDELMVAKGLTRRGLAREAGISASTLSTIIHGYHVPRISTLEKISDVLGCEIADITTRRED